MAVSAMDMVKEANAEVGKISGAEAKALAQAGDAVILDVRDAPELAKSGKLKGSVHISRGVLEFFADPTLPTFNAALDPAKTILVHCATGGRSALAAQTLRRLGYGQAVNAGGFQELIDAGIDTEPG